MTKRTKDHGKDDEAAQLGFALRDYRLRRRMVIFQLANELSIPSAVLVAIETNQPIEGNAEEVGVWLEKVKKLLGEGHPPAAPFIPPYLRG